MFESLFLVVLGFGLVGSVFTSARVLKEYERAVIFRMGRARKRLAGPGLTLLLPFGIDRPRIIDTRTKAIQIAPQDVITRDNISISVDAVVYATVASPQHAILEVEECMPATLQLAATTLERSAFKSSTRTPPYSTRMDPCLSSDASASFTR